MKDMLHQPSSHQDHQQVPLLNQRYPTTPHAPFSLSGTKCRLTAELHNFLGRPLVITEKLDGSNVRLHNGRAHPRSPNSNGRHPWLAMVRKHHEWKTQDHPSLEFYGEDIYGLHAIRYDPVPEHRTFYLFAIRQDTAWASWQEVSQWAAALDAPTVPVLHQGTFQTTGQLEELCLHFLAQPSTLGPEREGLVIRISEHFRTEDFASSICKIVRPNHVQPDQEHWSKHWEPCQLTRPKPDIPQ